MNRLYGGEHFFAPVIDHPPILEASVEDNLTYGRQGVDMALLECWLEKVKLGDGELFDGDWSKELSDISSGQKQRVQTLCALNQGRDILVLDEVTSQLDLESQKAVHELILSMPQTVLFATHQIDFYGSGRQSLVLSSRSSGCGWVFLEG